MRAGFGLGRLHHILSRASRERIVLGALDAGFEHFDVAPVYGDGFVEHELGRILGPRRARVTITTKFGIPFRAIGLLPQTLFVAFRLAGKLTKIPFGARYSERDFSPAQLVASLEASLKRLRTDVVDHFLMHEPRTREELARLADLWDTASRQQALGKLRRFGVSGDASLLLDAEKAGALPRQSTMMIPLNEASRAAPESVFSGREVFVFNIAKHLSAGPGNVRIDARELVSRATNAMPRAKLILASHRPAEIAAMGRALAGLSTAAVGACHE